MDSSQTSPKGVCLNETYLNIFNRHTKQTIFKAKHGRIIRIDIDVMRL